VRRRRRPGVCARASREKRGDFVRLPPPAANLNQGAHNGSNHMTKKPVAGDLVFQQTVLLMPLRPRHGADRAGDRAAHASEGDEVVGTDEQRRSARHRVERERLWKMPHERPIEGIGNGRIAHLIPIGLAAGAEPRMEFLTRVFHSHDSNLVGQVGIQRPGQRCRVVWEGDARAGDLSEGMHAGIGASRAVNRDRSAFEPCERLFEQALD